MEDTEVLLASLTSLLEPNVPDQADLLNALVDCNGNVEVAARLLRTSSSTQDTTSRAIQSNSRKRKRVSSSLDNWLSGSSSSSIGACSAGVATRDAGDFDFVAMSLEMSPRRASKIAVDNRSSGGSRQAGSPRANNGKPRSSKYSSKPIDLMSVLRSSSPEKTSVIRNPPLTLSNPVMVANHSPCTLHYSILPPRLACDLFYTMLDAAQGWSRNKWWLFDRLVESPHRTSFFARIEGFDIEGDTGRWNEAAQFWYNGRKTDLPHPFPEEMEEACKYVEKVVNEELQKRDRFPLEWGGSSGPDGYVWRANVAAANCYEGTKESVGFHSDQLTYLGPYPTIASLSLGTTRLFRLREVIPTSESKERQARTFNIPLPHNSLIIMHASTQERFKHCVPPQPTLDVFHPPFPRRGPPGTASALEHDMPSSNCRINITFRFYRPDFAPTTTPRCKCGVPCVLRPDMKGRVDDWDSRVKSWSRNNQDSPRVKKLPGEVTRANDDSGRQIKYWWACYSGAQNEGKGCGMWKVMDVNVEGRGPFVSDLEQDTT